MKFVIVLIFLVAVYYFLKSRKKSPGSGLTMEVKKFRLGDLEKNEIVHDALSDEQVKRITGFKEILGDVDPISLEETIENFRRDVHPDREIGIMEGIATVFQTVDQQKANRSPEERTELYNLILFRSMMSKEEVLESLQLKYFSAEQASEIIELYENHSN